MALFDKLHERKTPPGLEWQILKRLPRAALLGSLVPVALAVIARLSPMASGFDGAKRVKTVDIFAIASEITFLTALFTIAIGCVVVHVMKGPAYVCDAYPVSHSDRPEPPASKD
jgi:hypothetical protein